MLFKNSLKLVWQRTTLITPWSDSIKNSCGNLSCNNTESKKLIFEFCAYLIAKYLERLADCEVTLNGYSKYFLDALAKLADMVYPLIANNTYRQQPRNYNDYNSNAQPGFRRMNDTLNKMRQNY